jgi:Amt family ammonium transporter
MIDGNGGQIVNQLIATAASWGLAIVGTLVILKICDIVCGGVRVNEQAEIDGLDLTQHGEEGYNLEA